MKRYEALFILNLSGKEEGLKEAVDKVTAEIGAVGGKVETVQKMDKKTFSRVADRRHSSGFYLNVIFDARPTAIRQLNAKFALVEEVFRVLFSEAPTAQPVPAQP